MRKLLILISGLLGFAGSAMALSFFGGPPISVATLAQVASSTPTYVGQPVICSNCVSANGALGVLCISTEAANAQNAYIIAGSSLTAVTTCK
jgi:hypothetical protein